MMRRRSAACVSLAAAGALAVSSLAGCQSEPPPDPSQWPVTLADLQRDTEPSDPGEAAYARTCIACHGADGRGNEGRIAADFASPTGPLTLPDEVLLASIRNGKVGTIGTMPAHGALLSAEEQTAVLAYVRRTFGAGIEVITEVVDAGVDSGP